MNFKIKYSCMLIAMLVCLLSCDYDPVINGENTKPHLYATTKYKIVDTFQIFSMKTRFSLFVDSNNNSYNSIRVSDNIEFIQKVTYGIHDKLYVKNVDQLFFLKNPKGISYETYSNLGMYISMPLQTIINTIALNESKQFNRAELDSFFRRFLFGRHGFIDYVKLYDSSINTDSIFNESFANMSRPWGRKSEQINKESLSQFFDFIEKNKRNSNFFFYRGISGTSGIMGYFLITVNEQFSSDSTGSKYYKEFADMNCMYTIKCYFPYYILDL